MMRLSSDGFLPRSRVGGRVAIARRLPMQSRPGSLGDHDFLRPTDTMRTELISIPTDTAPLDGVMYTPESGSVRGAALYFHGNTMNFYVCAARFLPPVLTRLGLTFVAFNRRGHDILSTRASRIAEGGAFQTTAQAIEDNRI